MAIKLRYDNAWLVRIRTSGLDIKVTIGKVTKRRAKQIDQAVTQAVKYHDYSLLDADSRKILIKLFRNRDWTIPSALIERGPETRHNNRLILLTDAIRLTLDSLRKENNSNAGRHEQSFFLHIGPHFGANCVGNDIWIPQIKEFISHRLAQGASGSTINKDVAALSKMFSVLIEHQFLDRNPCRNITPAKEGEKREVYISRTDFLEILKHVPQWLRPIIHTLYLSGMRRGEVLGLTWENVDIQSRIIQLRSDQTKEGKSKRVPIHMELIHVFREAFSQRSPLTDHIFLIDGEKPPCIHSLRKPWKTALERAAESIRGLNGRLPLLTIHDLRHVWKTNAMRSGMDQEIRETILGHSLGIAGRYGRISNADLVTAIDSMTFEHGDSEILVTKRKN